MSDNSLVLIHKYNGNHNCRDCDSIQQHVTSSQHALVAYSITTTAATYHDVIKTITLTTFNVNEHNNTDNVTILITVTTGVMVVSLNSTHGGLTLCRTVSLLMTALLSDSV